MSKIINGYYGSWATYRPGKGKFGISNINPHLINMLSYSFFGINEDGTFRVLDDFDNTNIQKAIALKRVNRNLKVIAVVGGWGEGSAKYSRMAASSSKRQRFIQTTINFLKQHNFDGLDLDWEYPTQRGGNSNDRENFVILLRALSSELSRHDLTLGIAVAAAAHSAAISYNIPEISRYVDFINVMTYDFATSYDGRIGHNAPLHGNGDNNVEAAINYWLSEGAPAHKILLGIGFYGRTFKLSNTSNVSVGAPCSAAGSKGRYTGESGLLSYYEIYEDQWNFKWDSRAHVPFAYRGDQWVSYDDVNSIKEKVAFARNRNLRGIMIWSLDMDDFNNDWPLLRAINNEL